MGASGAFNGKRPVVEFVDRSRCVACSTPLDVFEVTPWSYTPRHLVVTILLDISELLNTTTSSDLHTFTFNLPWLSVFCMIAL